MRTDEFGNPCPETLGEYHALVAELAPDSRAAEYLEARIQNAPEGRSAIVIASDVQMRTLLFPMLGQPRLMEAAEDGQNPFTPLAHV